MKESKYKKELAEFDVEKAYKTEEVMDMLMKQPKRNIRESNPPPDFPVKISGFAVSISIF